MGKESLYRNAVKEESTFHEVSLIIARHIFYINSRIVTKTEVTNSPRSVK